LDLGDENSISKAAADVAKEGEVDLVVVASGLLHSQGVAPEKSYRHLSAESLQRYFAINATGPALVAKHFLPLLYKDRPAVFAALSARVGSIGDNRLGGWYGYRASKAALNMIVKSLAIELVRTRPQAVCVALHPGTVNTRLSEPFQRGLASESLFSPATAAENLLTVVSRLSPIDTGGCFAWDGSKICA
jgi:NAD(P)-dependent dehydrogenase (short-subunit alcohol dehydrogenase family)